MATFGERVDSLGVSPSFNDGDLVAGIMVIMQIVSEDGEETVRTAWSPGMGWITRRGLIETARDVEVVPSD